MEEFWNREGPAEIMMAAEGPQGEVHDLALVTQHGELLVGKCLQPSTELLLLQRDLERDRREGC